jgi:hypothetical protein
MPLQNHRIQFFLALLIACLCIAALAYLLLRPEPLVIETEQNGAQVYFAADRRLVLSPFECIDVRWRVGGIRTIFLNDKGQIGEGQATVCLTPLNAPTILITLPDDSQQTYSLDVRSVFLYPPTLALILVAIASLWYASCRLDNLRWQATVRSMFRLGHLVTAMGLLLFIQMAHLRFDLDDYNIITNGAPLNIDLDDLEHDTLEAEAADRDGQVERFLTVRDQTPANAVILIPLGVEHAVVGRAIAYPRKFYWVGNLERYLQRYVGDGSLSYISAASEHLRRIGQPDALEPLYLLLNEDLYEDYQALDYQDLSAGEILVDDDPFYILLTIKPSVSAEAVDAAVKAMQAR